MTNQDLKKLALLGIASGVILVSVPQIEAADNGDLKPQGQPSTTREGSNDTQQDDHLISQGYSNQGYFSNQDQGRSSNYYFQQNQKRTRNRSNQSRDNNYYDDKDYEGNYQNNNQMNQGYERGYRGQLADNTNSSTSETPYDNEDEKPNTEEKFLSKLSPQGQSAYQQLSTHGKIIAMNMAAHNCAGLNDCKNQNACRSDQNECAGKGVCKNRSSCKVTADEAIKLTSMLEKRNNLKISQ